MRQLGLSLGGTIANLERARYSRRQREAEWIEKRLREVTDPASAARLAAAYASTARNPDADKWTFAMISPQQNAAVVTWLSDHSKRPQAAVRLWALLFTALRSDTGEIMMTRADMADRVGIEPDNVSRIMTELAGINAVVRRKDGRAVRYFMNPNIATHLPSPEARASARANAGPLLVLMEGGKPPRPALHQKGRRDGGALPGATDQDL